MVIFRFSIKRDESRETLFVNGKRNYTLMENVLYLEYQSGYGDEPIRVEDFKFFSSKKKYEI